MKVLIVDRNQDVAEKNARVFSDISVAVYLYNGNEYIRHPACGSDATSEAPKSIDLVLVNQDDAGLLPQSLADAVIVRYRSDRSARELWIRSRALSSQAPLTKDEVLSLVEWSSEGASVDDKPDIMLPRQHVLSIIPAMMIMCQGYLSSHFPNPENTEGVIKETLDKFDWNSNFTSSQTGSQIAKIASAKKEETEQPWWWVGLFDSDVNNDSDAKEYFNASEFKREFRYRKLGQATQEIVDKLLARECIIDPELVAKAYLEMEELL